MSTLEERVRVVGIASHTTEVPGPFHALESYAVRRFGHTVSAAYPFGYTRLKEATLRVWAGTALERERRVRAPRVLSLARDVVCTLFWFGAWNRTDAFIGINNVNAICGIVLRWLGRTSSVIYYAIDYTPVRFTNRFLNWAYHAVDGFVARHSDSIWNLSPGMAEIRLRQGQRPEANHVVPIGVDLDIVPPENTSARRDLVIVSHLVETKGIQLALKAFEIVATSYPDVRLHIIGTGPYEARLKELAREGGVAKRVLFHGRLEYREMYEVLVNASVAIAPYPEDVNNIARYTDVGKPKEYLACGLPVVITAVTSISDEIGARPMGVVVRYSADDIASGILVLLNDAALREKCSRNARQFMQGMTWSAIYDRAFAQSLGDTV